MTEPEQEMKEIKINSNLLDVIDGVMKYIKKNHRTNNWETETTFKFSANKKPNTLTFPEFTEDGEEQAGTQEVILSVIPEVEQALLPLIAELKLDINAEEIANSIFVGSENVYKTDYIKLGKNVKVFRQLNKFFSRYGIEQFAIRSGLTSDIHNYCSEKMTIIVTPPVTRGNTGCPLSSDMWSNYSGLDGYKRPTIEGEKIEECSYEKSTEIKIGNYEIGRYYNDRNLILLWFNPFTGIEMSKYDSYTENKWLAKILPEIMKAIVDIKINLVKVTDFSIRLLVDSFKKQQSKLIRDTKAQLESAESEIQTYSTSLSTAYEKRITAKDSLQCLGTLDKDQVEREVKLLQANPLLELVELKEGAIFITFKETSIKCPLRRNNDDFGIREMYLGKIGFKLSGGNKIKVLGDSPRENDGNPHPHADGHGGPCFGSGEGQRKIMQLLGERKLNDLASMLWMWIHTYRSSDAYVHVDAWYNDRLKQGYPVFDHKGTPITINEKDRITSKEQQKLDKASNWDKNQQKHKDFQPQK